jgi:signal transduction histidine kinase
VGYRWTDAMETRYRARVETEVLEAYRTATLLGVVLFPAFSLLDYITQRASFVPLSAIRYGTTVVFIALYVGASHGVRPARSPFVSGLLVLALASLSITALCLVLEGYRSPYYAGINLVVLAAAVLFPWGARWMALAVVVVLGSYVLGVLATARFVIERPDVFVNNCSFLLGTAIIGVTSAGLSDRLRRESFMRFLEVERLDQSKTQFFANVSHELRTPLALILGPVEKLQGRGDLDAGAVADLQIVRRNALALLGHVDDLLDVARLEAGKETLRHAAVDLAAMVRRSAGNFELFARDRAIELRVEAPPEARVEVDPQKIDRVLLNLLSNAFKFTPRGGRIRISLEANHDEAIVTVADSGPGIPEELRESVFERFFQAEESTTRSFGGTGLGLSIVKDFVELHRGRVTIGSAPEGGASLRVVLPAKAPPGTTLAEDLALDIAGREKSLRPPPAPARRESEPAPSGNEPLVLVVEDHPDMRDYLAAALRGSGYRVATAGDGIEALEIVDRVRADLIVSDVMMPRMSGADLIRELRAREETREVPILVLTAKADDELRAQLLREGAQDYMLKPFSIEELRARVGNWVAVQRTRTVLASELRGSRADLETLARRLARKRTQLRATLRTTRKARDSAREALHARDEFMLMAAHELRTPLSSMLLQNEHAERKLAQPGADVSSVARFVRRSHEQVKRLHHLVEDMLDFARISAGRLPLERSDTDLVALTRAVMERFSEHLLAAGVEVRLHLPDQPVQGRWDGYRIEQVISNLITNAAKYGAGKPVEVTVAREGSAAVLTVRDFGIGIAKAKQQIIFERFERAVPSKHISGLGLGLYISKQITELHGGTIRVDSEPGKGATFTVELPLA